MANYQVVVGPDIPALVQCKAGVAGLYRISTKADDFFAYVESYPSDCRLQTKLLTDGFNIHVLLTVIV